MEKKQKNFLKPGSEFAGFVIDKLIGEGSAGSVYLGKRLKEKVAIKILTSQIYKNGALMRFQREAEILAKISDKNIIELLGTGIIKGTHYLVMKFFSGKSLDCYQEQRKFSLTETISIITQVAKAMIAVHEKGIIHRDLKPSNLLYDREQNLVKIVDFGIARPVTTNQKITKSNVVVGTPHYMSPEQCLGNPVDHRSDIYSLGATFYHMITGKLPFSGTNIMDIFSAHITSNISWKKEIPISLRSIIEKMMAKYPENRYQNMNEVVEELNKAEEIIEKLLETKEMAKYPENNYQSANEAMEFNKTKLLETKEMVKLDSKYYSCYL